MKICDYDKHDFVCYGIKEIYTYRFLRESMTQKEPYVRCKKCGINCDYYRREE